ncbi:MAG: T9SS type A sorting domain-containing protein, partial [Flavobacteriales bacterium]
TFVDTTDPVIINAPVDITVECSDDVPAYVPMWSDNCDDSLTLEAASSISIDDCYEFIHQTYTATDDCGNSTTVVRNINIVDTTDPILSGVPADATVECSNIPAPAQPTATDNCDENVNISYNQEIVPGDGCTYTIIRTWTATDECDNSVSDSQTLTVTDTTDPTITNNPPVEYNIECGDAIPTNDPIFADNCDNDLDIDYSEVEVSGACPGGLMRTWIATDNCGNSISFVQYIFIHDTTAPVLTGEDEEYTLECNIQASIIEPTATDACDTDVHVDFNLEVTPGDCPNSWTEVYTWTAEDNCENVSVRTITIHYQDTTAPELSAYPASATVECDEVPVAIVITATDNCDDEVVVDFDENTEAGECGSVITRTWTAVDDCGNDVSHVQVLTVVDTTDPYVTTSVPAELTIECNTEVPAYTPGFDDNCDENLTIVPTENEINFTNCGYDIVRTWTAYDNCDNTALVTQTIHVVDSIDPILVGVPANATVECNEVPGAPLVTATDNCDDNVTVGLVTTQTEGCPYTITRTWTATDDCGNVTTASQVITVVDTTLPYIVEGVPAELTIECDQDEPAYTPVFGDNCDDDLNVTAISGIANFTPCSYDIERAWTATDNCDNSFTVYQVIHVVDTTNPVLIGVPANATVECDNVPAPAAVTAEDNCAENLNVVLTADTTMMECGYVITRTWNVYDNCQNPATATQIVTVVDTTNPVIETALSDASIECGEEIPAVPIVVASDNCDANVNITFNSEEVALECGYMIVRTWVATDDCGNEDSAEQIIYVIDETAPVISGIPADITIECDLPIPAPAAATATDNCDENVVVTTNDMFIQQDCFYQIKRYYTAVDACGNTTSIPQIITVVDTTDPIIVAPADITVNCDAIPAPAELSATDNCDIDVTVTYAENEGEGCPYTIERIWTATDDCGNTTTVSQIVTVIDEVYPVFEAFPPYVVIECDEVESYMVSATDNCDNQVEITVIQEFPVSGECYGSLLRVYQAEDNCGNITVTGTQIIDIVDSTPPTLIGVPADVFITCGEELPAVAEVTADDNCAVDLTVQFTQTQTNEFCPYDVIRTWSTIDDCGNVTVLTQTIHVSVEVPGFVQLSAYPNPADQHFTVKFSVASDKEVKGGIFDVTGREVLPIMNGNADGGRLYQWEMDARSLGQGSYMIQMIVDGEVYHQKMIISVK